MAADDPVEVKHHLQHRYPAAARYCPLCASQMVQRLVLPDRRHQSVCAACGFVHFQNPKLVAGCIVVRDREVLLLRRGNEPARGKWTFPGGYVEFGENPLQAALRETREEVRMDVVITKLLGLYWDQSNPVAVVAAYLAEAGVSDPQTSDEALEVAFFKAAEIPWRELAFTTTRLALEDFAKLP